MCLECENQHCHVFGSGDDDGEHPVADLVEMITYFEGECLRNSTTNKSNAIVIGLFAFFGTRHLLLQTCGIRCAQSDF